MPGTSTHFINLFDKPYMISFHEKMVGIVRPKIGLLSLVHVCSFVTYWQSSSDLVGDLLV